MISTTYNASQMSPEAECDVCQLVALGVDILLTQQPVVVGLDNRVFDICGVNTPIVPISRTN